MLSLAFLLHIERTHNSYGAAGLVLGALSVGQAVAGPLTSRLMGVWGMRPVLTATLAVCSISVIWIAVVEMPISLTMLVAIIAGLSMPPVQPAVRTIYPTMVNSRQLTPLFSLDASVQEVIWISGPVVITFVSTQIGTMWGIFLSVLIMLGGGIWFIALPEVGNTLIPRSTRRIGAVLGKPPVVLVTLVGFLLIGSCAAIEAGVVATFPHSGAEAGIVLAVFSIASLLGGLAFGHVPIGPWALASRMFIVFVGLALALAGTSNFWWLIGTLVVAGIGIAPAFAILFAIVSATVTFRDTAEAYGWAGTGQLIGAALGSSLAGFLIDANGPVGAFWVAGAFAAVGFIVPLVGKPWHPDLRDRTAQAIADTGPVPTTPA